MKGYIRKDAHNRKQHLRRRRKTPAEKQRPDFAGLAIEGLKREAEINKHLDMGQTSVDALERAVRKEMAARMKKEIESGPGDTARPRRDSSKRSSTP